MPRRVMLQKGFLAIVLAALAACNSSNPGGGGSSSGGSSSSGSSSSSSSSSSSGSSSGSSSSGGTSSSSGSSSGGSSGSSSSGSSGGLTGDVYTVTNLVADVAGLHSDGAAAATRLDTRLVNPWGIVIAPSAPVWIANNGSQSSTLYDGEGMAPRGPVAIPPGGNGDADVTGIVHNASGSDFMISKNGVTRAAAFLFSGEGGALSAWSPAVDANNAVTAYSDAGGAVYKGLALAGNAGAQFLYATDFHNNKIDVFDHAFAKVSGGGSFPFADPALPAGYAPFGIAALTVGGQTLLYVTYARQVSGSNDEAHGAGLGLVEVYKTDGTPQATLVHPGGALDAPWGLALAPSDFGSIGGDLLVANFGDGTLHAYDPVSGAPAGTLGDAAHHAIAIDGLWGIAFGNDASGLNQPHNTLFFTAGSNAEADGTYGRIDLGPSSPDFKPSVVITAPAPGASVSGTVNFMAQAGGPVAIAKVEFFVNSQSLGSVTAAPYHLSWDTTTAANGAATLTATVTDVDGNTNTADAVSVTVANAAHITLTQLQQQFFTPICSTCHNGQGTTLPGSQNFTAGNTYGQTVNHPSVEKPALFRIKPNDPANSYLIQKIEGASGIAGSQMPQGCPFTQPCLTQEQINMFIDWVNSGAPNN